MPVTAPKPRNFVAKHMNSVNRATVQRDRKRDAKIGKTKHKAKYF